MESGAGLNGNISLSFGKNLGLGLLLSRKMEHYLRVLGRRVKSKCTFQKDEQNAVLIVDLALLSKCGLHH